MDKFAILLGRGDKYELAWRQKVGKDGFTSHRQAWFNSVEKAEEWLKEEVANFNDFVLRSDTATIVRFEKEFGVKAHTDYELVEKRLPIPSPR